MPRLQASALVILLFATPAYPDDWPMLGRDRTHNAVSPEKGGPIDWQLGVRHPKTGDIKKAARNIKWSVELGSRNMGGPVVAGGLVWVGTNNDSHRDPSLTKDAAVLMCFRERDGKFLWQYVSPRLGEIWQDTPRGSMGSTPLVEGERLWLITNRCETLCFDIGPLSRGDGVPKVLWKVDMIRQFGVKPFAPIMAAGYTPSPAADSERIFAVTGNGVERDYVTLLAPNAPSLVCFDKKTGATLWTDASPGKDILHSQRSSPLVVEIEGRTQVIVGQGDGWLRSFEAKTGKLIWKCDLNPKNAVRGFANRGTRNYPMAAPVLHDGLVYVALGQDPEHGGGVNYLSAIDPTGTADVSLELPDGPGKGKPNPNSRVMWRFGGIPDRKTSLEFQRDNLFSRTLAECVVQDGLVYACDIEGYLFCFDAKNGKPLWWHDLKSTVWSTPLCVDNKLYIGTEDGDVWIFAQGKDKKLLKQIEGDGSAAPIYSAPVFANGVLYVMTTDTLYAIEEIKTPLKRRAGDVLFLPTPQDVVIRMLALAEVRKDDVLADLGCGDGRIVATAAQKYGCKALGIDIDKALVEKSLANVKKLGVESLVRIEHADLFHVDLSDVSVVTLYLGPVMNEKLLPQLGKMKSGSRIVSHAYAIPGIKPAKVIKFTSTEDDVERPIYLYTVPLKRE
jgi:outer membrane protein assembly factor BamB/precorrin-6B methylase 2